MNKYFSDKLRAIGFTLMVMVVFFHSYNLLMFNSGTIKQGYNSFIQDLFSRGVTEIAVPLFFIISGYLFFLSIKNGSISEFLSKYRKRAKTLILPYIFWSIYGILFYLILQSIPFTKAFFSKGLFIVDYSVTDLLTRIFWKSFAFQFWFIRDLIMLVLLSPILYYLIKYLRIYIILIFFFTWMYGFDYLIFTNASIFFFSIGGLLSIKNINIQNYNLNSKYLIFSFVCVWLVLLIIKTSLVQINFENEMLIEILLKSGIIIGVISIWFLYDYIYKNIDISKTKAYTLFQYTFFLYAFHEPLLQFLIKGFGNVFGQSELALFLIYISTPIIIIFVSISIGHYAKRFVPKFYYLSTGGR
jgi:surface polysaccharide O-acyltransferase-like enzyme